MVTLKKARGPRISHNEHVKPKASACLRSFEKHSCETDSPCCPEDTQKARGFCFHSLTQTLRVETRFHSLDPCDLLRFSSFIHLTGISAPLRRMQLRPPAQTQSNSTSCFERHLKIQELPWLLCRSSSQLWWSLILRIAFSEFT